MRILIVFASVVNLKRAAGYTSYVVASKTITSNTTPTVHPVEQTGFIDALHLRAFTFKSCAETASRILFFGHLLHSTAFWFMMKNCKIYFHQMRVGVDRVFVFAKCSISFACCPSLTTQTRVLSRVLAAFVLYKVFLEHRLFLRFDLSISFPLQATCLTVVGGATRKQFKYFLSEALRGSIYTATWCFHAGVTSHQATEEDNTRMMFTVR